MTTKQRDENSNGSIVTPRLIIGVVSPALLLAFVVQNSAQSEIGFLWFNVAAAVWTFFIIIFALGWISGWFSYGRSKK